jgi:hypothetical protein
MCAFDFIYFISTIPSEVETANESARWAVVLSGVGLVSAVCMGLVLELA